jgi:hypothetical protein
MSFSDVLEGAESGFVSTHGQKPAHFSILFLRLTSVTNRETSTQKLGIWGLS